MVAERPDGRLLLAPLVREAGRWRRARPRDGASAALVEALDHDAALGDGFRLRSLRPTGRLRGERAIGVDQTNESVVVGTTAVVKWLADPAPRDLSVPDLQAHLAAVGFQGCPRPSAPSTGWMGMGASRSWRSSRPGCHRPPTAGTGASRTSSAT
ncbi:MAG: hypothetical protein U0667_10345 [Chloroflexota bacterium]